MIYECIIIGGGASGLFCAASDAFRLDKAGSSDGAKLQDGDATFSRRRLILEATSRVGTKVLMSGGGRCNVTHDGSVKDLVDRYNNGRAIRKCLYRHSNLELRSFLTDNGIELITEDDGRVFPASGKASDIRDLLVSMAQDNGFSIRTDSKVTGIRYDEADGAYTVTCYDPRADEKSGSGYIEYMAKNLVIATGGCSYPATGSDGSMFTILERDLHIEHTELRPALCAIRVTDYPYKDISGISVDALIRSRKEKSEGSLLFTESGFSGPAALNISGELKAGDTIEINYIHPVDTGEAASRLQKAVTGSKSGFANIIADLFDLPKRFCRMIAERSGGSTKAAAAILTRDVFCISEKHSGDEAFRSAMVTRGGVSLTEIDTATMRCVDHEGIYVIGEALDIDGQTGGYNLQFAFSSARAASEDISRQIGL